MTRISKNGFIKPLLAIGREVQVLLPAPNRKTAIQAVFFAFGLTMPVSAVQDFRPKSKFLD